MIWGYHYFWKHPILTNLNKLYAYLVGAKPPPPYCDHLFIIFLGGKWISSLLIYLVGGFNPFEKYARQIGNLPQIGVKIKNL